LTAIFSTLAEHPVVANFASRRATKKNICLSFTFFPSPSLALGV
jgi:hypothetical protein